MKQCILVLGANGFIGRAVVADLAATDWAKPILGVRKPLASESALFEQRRVEATSVESVAAAMQGVTAVVNCVAGDAHTIVSATKTLIEAAGRMPETPQIIHISSMAVYGSAVGLVDEKAPLRGDLGPYSAAKVAAEAIAAAYPRTVIFRPGCVFGPGSEQWTIRIARLLLVHRLGDLGASGDGYCNLVHISDVSLAILRTLEDPRTDGGVFNLSTPEPPTWNEFLVKYGTALRAVPVRRISQRRLRLEGKVLAPALKVAEIVCRACKIDARQVPPFIPPSMIRSMSQEICLDTKCAESKLGLRWKDTDAALSETAGWFLESESAS